MELTVLWSFLFFLTTYGFLCRFVLEQETYRLARASLYGNLGTMECGPNAALWPATVAVPVTYVCLAPGHVRGRLQLPFAGQVCVSVDLSWGRAERTC